MRDDIICERTLLLGFNLWTSAHGYHHLSLTQSSAWKAFWAIVIAIASIALVACIIYYFYYVFAFAVYSRCLFHQHFTRNFLYKSFAQSFFVLTF